MNEESKTQKHIAVIAPGILPVPAVSGGAVESLTSMLLEGMDRDNDISEFDLYTISDSRIETDYYEKGNLIFINTNLFDCILTKVGNAFCKATKSVWRFRPYHIALLRSLKRKKYDFVLVENNMELYHVVWTYTRNRKNMIYHLHNDLDDYAKSPARSAFISKTAKRYMVVSEYLKRRVQDAYPNGTVDVFFNAIHMDSFAVNDSVRNQLRRKFAIPKDTAVILYSGRIDPTKGVLELAQAFLKLKKEGQNCALMIVGTSWFGTEQISEYMQEVKTCLQTCGQVYFTGYISPEKMPDYVSAADIVAIPSMWEEPFGLVALEAMAARKPIIATRSGGMQEILDDSRAVMIDITAHVQEDLYLGLKRLLGDGGLCRKLSQQGYDYVRGNPCYDAKNYYDHFKKFLKGKPGE